MSPAKLDIILIGVAVLGVAGIITLVLAIQRGRYYRFRKRYERLHPLTTKADTISTRVVDTMLARENDLENDRILACISTEKTYSIYAGSLVMAGMFWIIAIIALRAFISYPTPVLALLIILTPLSTMIFGKVLFRKSIQTSARKVRKLLGPSIPNLLILLRLEIAESTDPATALKKITESYAAFISPQGFALLQDWLGRAQNEELGTVLVTEGERFDLQEVITLGKALERGSQGMALSAVLNKQIASTSELSQYAVIGSIRRRIALMGLLFVPALISMLIVTLVSLVAIAGGVHTFTSFL
jgi:hypothetical protein